MIMLSIWKSVLKKKTFKMTIFCALNSTFNIYSKKIIANKDCSRALIKALFILLDLDWRKFLHKGMGDDDDDDADGGGGGGGGIR